MAVAAMRTYVAAAGTTVAPCPNQRNTVAEGSSAAEMGTESRTASTRPRCTARATPTWSLAPMAWETSGSSTMRMPAPSIATVMT